jgi:hypothetical protein
MSAAVRAMRAVKPALKSRLRSMAALVGWLRGRPGKSHEVPARPVPSRSVDSLLIQAAKAGGRSIGVEPKVVIAPPDVIAIWSKRRVLMRVAVWA